MSDASNGKHRVIQARYVSDFRCEFDDCVESCCSNYGLIKVEKYLVDHYQEHAPEFLQYLKTDDPAQALLRIERNTCTAHDGKLCRIQLKLGAQFIPEICHFYPRRFTRLDDVVYVSSNLPCSLMIRSALMSEDAFAWNDRELERMPSSLPNVRENNFPGYTAAEVFAVHAQVAAMAEESGTSEQLMVRLLALSELLDSVKKTDWPFLIKGLVRASRKRASLLFEEVRQRPREDDFVFGLCHSVLAVIRSMSPPGVTGVIRGVCELIEAVDAVQIKEMWREYGEQSPLDDLLKRYLRAKVAENVFPVANWGDCVDDSTFIAICYAMARLSVLAHVREHERIPEVDDVVRSLLRIEWWAYGRRQQIYDRLKAMGWANSTNKLLELVINY